MKLRTHEHTYQYNWKSATVRTPRIETNKKSPVVDKVNSCIEWRANDYVAEKVWAKKKTSKLRKAMNCISWGNKEKNYAKSAK